MSIERNEQILGEFRLDYPDGKWFTSESKNSFVRFYSSGFREIVHKTELYIDDYDTTPEYKEGWTVSIGYNNQFDKGYKIFSTARAAKEWADNRDDIELQYLDESRERLMNRHRKEQEQ